ncbi:adenine-specific DNA methylase [Bacillus cereus]|uniref:Adenine-specific DNA methylase n=1 Tax=Bacillus cereus TaxID=1396 RepID=A0A9X8NSS8_BACCE|nr:adenine-specific DNA methylase [Bacillus cereus]RWQ69824.1 adenine-specific DNA methylase [Bacillus cereus]
MTVCVPGTIIERVWCMPNKNTFDMKPIKDLLNEEITPGVWIDPYANKSKYASITNDLNPEFDTDYHMDALDFLKMFQDNHVNGVLYDPPYSPRQIKEAYESFGLDTKGGLLTRSSYWGNQKDEIARIVTPGAKVICFGWNSNGMGKKRGFTLSRMLIVAHGGNHNDTICTVWVKN